MSDVNAWETEDEVNALNYMASREVRPSGKIPSLEDRKERLESWLIYSTIRKWPDGVDVGWCRHYCQKLLREI